MRGFKSRHSAHTATFGVRPMEPTERMLAAGQRNYDNKLADMNSPTPTEDVGIGPLGYAYLAMKALDPTIPKSPQDMNLRELFDHVAIVNDAIRAALLTHPGMTPMRREPTPRQCPSCGSYSHASFKKCVNCSAVLG